MSSIFSEPTLREQKRMHHDEMGVLTYFPAMDALPGSPYCVVFPGYTGDAVSHQKFIQESLSLGISVLCVTPSWSTSTKQTRENVTSLIRFTKSLGISEEQPYFVRGVSFGCDLSLAWLNEWARQPRKIAWITPCSAAHLEYAGQTMRMPVKNDAEQIHFQTTAPVWVQSLESDEVVPTVDSAFLSASENTKRSILTGADHFQAGELPEASVEVARWFREGL